MTCRPARGPPPSGRRPRAARSALSRARARAGRTVQAGSPSPQAACSSAARSRAAWRRSSAASSSSRPSSASSTRALARPCAPVSARLETLPCCHETLNLADPAARGLARQPALHARRARTPALARPAVEAGGCDGGRGWRRCAHSRTARTLSANYVTPPQSIKAHLMRPTGRARAHRVCRCCAASVGSCAGGSRARALAPRDASGTRRAAPLSAATLTAQAPPLAPHAALSRPAGGAPAVLHRPAGRLSAAGGRRARPGEAAAAQPRADGPA